MHREGAYEYYKHDYFNSSQIVKKLVLVLILLNEMQNNYFFSMVIST